jgi:acetyl esterase/lipase
MIYFTYIYYCLLGYDLQSKDDENINSCTESFLCLFQLPQQNGSHNEQNGELLDVMFWIHGGLFYSGSAENYPPEFLMDKNVVLVSFNYRLGVYGKSH